MKRFTKLFPHSKFNVIGMIHVGPLPGTPLYKNGSWPETVEKVKYEAHVYAEHNLDSLLIENMYDIPYLPERYLGPETTACMTIIGNEVRKIFKHHPIGIQVLACGNQQALAVAKASNLQYIRAEGFVFGHVADEGYTEACAGKLLRYRHQIDANDVLIFTDLKKKHSSHAITQDLSLVDTAKAAEFFSTDGIIITGNTTGDPVNCQDLLSLCGHVNLPILLGSGITHGNLHDYDCDAVIVGSHFKVNGCWKNSLCPKKISSFMDKVYALRKTKC